MPVSIEKVHEDKRGRIHIISGLLPDELEVGIYRTNKGFARGGYIHPNTEENLVVIKGRILAFIDGELKVLTEGDATTIPENTPHIYFALTDMVFMEWGIPDEEKQHGPERHIVDEINEAEPCLSS